MIQEEKQMLAEIQEIRMIHGCIKNSSPILVVFSGAEMTAYTVGTLFNDRQKGSPVQNARHLSLMNIQRGLRKDQIAGL